MGRSGAIRRVIETEEDVARETRRLAQRIRRLLNPDLIPDEEPHPAVCAIDSVRELPEYPVSRRRIGVPGPPGEPYPPPPGRSPRIQAPAIPPPRLRRVQGLTRRQRPILALAVSESALSPIAENPAPCLNKIAGRPSLLKTLLMPSK